MFLTPSVPNLQGQGIEGSETKDADEDETLSVSGDADANSGMTDVGNASIFSGQRTSGGNPGLEARRQLLIENLIGMVCQIVSALLI
jgi:hypothetical protein